MEVRNILILATTCIAAGAACGTSRGSFDTGTQSASDGGAGIVYVPAGTHVECVLSNIPDPARLTLVKRVVNAFGGDKRPDDWTLTAGPLARTIPSEQILRAIRALTVSSY